MCGEITAGGTRSSTRGRARRCWYNDLQTQAAVGTGTGVLGDRKKISTNASGGRYVADDQFRPPTLITYDMRGNRVRTDLYLDGLLTPTSSDLASDSDNAWTDAANVDGHVHVGWTYDFSSSVSDAAGWMTATRRSTR